MTDQELFSELVKDKVVSQADADKVLADASFAGTSPEEMLYARGLGNETAIAKVKSRLLNIPYKKIDTATIPDDLLKLIPKETSQNYRVAPVERKDNMLIVGMLHPHDTQAQEALRFIAKRERLNLGVYLVTPGDLEAVWRRYVPFRSEIDEAVKTVAARGEAETQRRVSLEERVAQGEEAPIIKIVASALKRAVEIKASDVHIEPQRVKLRIRFRVDGDLEEAAVLPAALIQPVVSRVKVLASLKLDETRVPQDGRFRAEIQGRDIDFRVATFPTPNGEKVVIRVLDPTTGLKGFDKLGLSPYNLNILEEAIDRPYGMVLITGPTGSGKSTTLYAIMQQLNTDDVNIVTLEDPVEYFMEGVNQSQVKPEIGYTFASGLRQILRQDPDIVMVGEIRDSETAGLAVNAALTGHMMLSTLHTNNSIGVIPRLTDLGVPTFLLSSALNLMLAQRLIGRLCPNCKAKTEAPPEAQTIIAEAIGTLPKVLQKDIAAKFSKPYSIYKVNPKPECKTCKGKGIAGRVAIFEVFRMTRELGDIINKGFTEGALEDEAVRQGIVTLQQDGIIKALEGDVLLEEILKETT